MWPGLGDIPPRSPRKEKQFNERKKRIKNILDQLDPDLLDQDTLKKCVNNACLFNLGEHVKKFSVVDLGNRYYGNLYTNALWVETPPITDIYETIIEKSTLDSNVVWTDIVFSREDLHIQPLLTLKIESPRRRGSVI